MFGQAVTGVVFDVLFFFFAWTTWTYACQEYTLSRHHHIRNGKKRNRRRKVETDLDISNWRAASSARKFLQKNPAADK